VLTALLLGKGVGQDRTLKDFIKAQRFQLLLSETAVDSLVMARRFHPGLVLLDYDVRGPDHPALLADMLFECPDSSVLVLMAAPRAAEVVAALRQGAADFFDRPLDFKRLQQSIDMHRTLLGC
jgi:DNA-binding NtrC family response regulator